MKKILKYIKENESNRIINKTLLDIITIQDNILICESFSELISYDILSIDEIIDSVKHEGENINTSDENICVYGPLKNIISFDTRDLHLHIEMILKALGMSLEEVISVYLEEYNISEEDFLSRLKGE